ncbi:unnamed protein product, partial [Fusarium graminearum]
PVAPKPEPEHPAPEPEHPVAPKPEHPAPPAETGSSEKPQKPEEHPPVVTAGAAQKTFAGVAAAIAGFAFLL